MSLKKNISVVNSWTMFEVLKTKSEFDDSFIEESKIKFKEYKDQGIIKNSLFDDETWQMYDEYNNQGIYFDINKDSYNLHYKKETGMTHERFTECLKAFVIFCIGDYVLNTLASFVNDIKKICAVSIFMLDEINISITFPNVSETFFETLPMENENAKEQIVASLILYAESKISYNTIQNRRELSDFMSYFKFGYLLDKYWKQTISEDERLFYYPVYLWWKITGIIPTRPREFILTPRNCLTRENGTSMLILRKSNLKGSNRKVNYNIEKDYIKVQFPISESLADEIEMYIKMTEKYPDNELHTLFRAEPHFAKFNMKKSRVNRFYTYVNLSCVLRIFYYEILQENYGLKVSLSKGELDYSFDNDNIQFINLGETRHISMINAIAEGCSPEIVMQMAGHESVDMSAHYYSNMSTYVECRTYAKFMAMKQEDINYILGKNCYIPSNVETFIKLENDARCYSKALAEGDMTDCIAASGENGEIGYCPSCRFYRQGGFGYFFTNTDIYKNKIDTDLEYLQKIVKLVRQGKGMNEDIREALLRFKSDRHDYELYLFEKFEKERREKLDGKA
ncbi:hypothetical protein [Aminipila sp.]|uniref:hypothetical protein n=1 Tax=Aminipila sp. TaxID=2060095 RepID=UPI00289E8B1E|nr:hypothetical protein [Aminipila sp.]